MFLSTGNKGCVGGKVLARTKKIWFKKFWLINIQINGILVLLTTHNLSNSHPPPLSNLLLVFRSPQWTKFPNSIIWFPHGVDLEANAITWQIYSSFITFISKIGLPYQQSFCIDRLWNNYKSELDFCHLDYLLNIVT